MVTRTIKIGCVGMCLLGYSIGAMGQVITFNSPAPWLTLRNDSILVKAQLDTSKFPKKQVTFAVSKVENNKKKVVSTKTFKVSDFTQDFYLGLAGTGLIGGKDFIKIEWNVIGAADKGYCSPIGIVSAEKINKVKPLHVSKASGQFDPKNIAGLISGKQFTKVQNREFAFLWNQSGLAIFLKKAASKETLKFTFDGKNGKNAFVSYPDKMIGYFAEKDSLHAYINERLCTDSIAYTEKPWTNDISKASDKDYVMIKISWYDMGIAKPFEGRVMGFAAFAIPEKGPAIGFPDKAALFLPGSWGSLVLDK